MGTQTGAAPRGSPNAQPASNPFVTAFPMLFIFGVIYFLIIRPQQKQTKEHKNLVDNLKSGDRVVTQGGIYGTVTTIKGTIVQVKIADNVKVDVSRSAITQVLLESTNGSPAVLSGEKPA